MARRNKLQKFTELLTFPNVYENFDPETEELVPAYGEKIKMKGNWNSGHFQNSNPLVLELACGRGEYTVALAERYPEKNFVGVDIKGARIWKGARQALQAGLSNAAFLRTKIEFCSNFFAEAEVDEIWITFPDPFLKSSKFNRRLTSPNFLELYRKFLKRSGIIHLKTDSEELYQHSLEVLESERHKILVNEKDIYGIDKLPQADLEIRTYYENMHLKAGKTIKYLQFMLNYPSDPPQSDSSPGL